MMFHYEVQQRTSTSFLSDRKLYNEREPKKTLKEANERSECKKMTVLIHTAQRLEIKCNEIKEEIRAKGTAAPSNSNDAALFYLRENGKKISFYVNIK